MAGCASRWLLAVLALSPYADACGQPIAEDIASIVSDCDSGNVEAGLATLKRRLALPAVQASDTPNTAHYLESVAYEERKRGAAAYNTALQGYFRALGIRLARGGPTDPMTGTTLSYVALLHSWTGDANLAVAEYKCVIAIRTASSSPVDVAEARGALAAVYLNMGLQDDARQQIDLALASKPSWPSNKEYVEANLVTTQAGIATDPTRRLELYGRALSLNEIYVSKGGLRLNAEISRDNLGVALRDAGRTDDAIRTFQETLKQKERSSGIAHDTTATTLFNLGVLYEQTGQQERAAGFYRRAVQIAYLSDPTDLTKSSALLSRLALFSERLADTMIVTGQPEGNAEAMFYYKLSVNARQRMRAGTEGLEPRVQRALTDSLSSAYRSLAQVLTRRGHVADAEYVLSLLKETELTTFMTRAGASPAKTSIAPWTPAEREYVQALQKASLEWQSLSATWQTVADESENKKREVQAKEWDDLLARRTALQDRMQSALTQAAATLERKSARPIDLSQVYSEQTKLSETLQSMRLSAAQRNSHEQTAGIALVPGPKYLLMIVTTRNGSVPEFHKLPEAELNAQIRDFRAAIANRQPYRDLGARLYEELIRPAEKILANSGMGDVDQLAVLAYGDLSTLPFAALVRRESPTDHGIHLVEKYSVVALTADGNGGLDGLKEFPPVHWRGVALGSSLAVPDFDNVSLPGVKAEVCGIVKDEQGQKCSTIVGQIPGDPYLDGDFTSDRLRRLLGAVPEDKPLNFLHIATHYNSQKATLLVGDATVAASTIIGWRPRVSQYDLIALSACSSGIDSTGVESLGGLLRKQGARAVLATLWPVADAGAQAIMVEFYRQIGREKKLTKAAALRAAQRHMIKGDLTAAGFDFTAPYYWAPYVLMGNWL